MVKAHSAETEGSFVFGARTQHFRLSKLHTQVLEFFRSKYPNGATDYDLEEHLGRPHTNSDARRRRGELVKQGLIRDSGLHQSTGKYKKTIWAAVPWQDETKQGDH